MYFQQIINLDYANSPEKTVINQMLEQVSQNVKNSINDIENSVSHEERETFNRLLDFFEWDYSLFVIMSHVQKEYLYYLYEYLKANIQRSGNSDKDYEYLLNFDYVGQAFYKIFQELRKDLLRIFRASELRKLFYEYGVEVVMNKENSTIRWLYGVDNKLKSEIMLRLYNYEYEGGDRFWSRYVNILFESLFFNEA